MSLKAGLEIHQQLECGKLFCKCGTLETGNDNVFTRKLHATSSEMGTVDAAAKAEGINRFTFLMKEGNGDITLEENIYIKVFTWCPILVYLFSLIGIWGSFITYKRQSYKNAQIGAFFSVMAMGFLVVGPILGIMALYYLKKHKKIFTASFKN